MTARICRRCGAQKTLMNFGFAGQDWECPNGPWGTHQHETLESTLHAFVWPILMVLMALIGGLLFVMAAAS